MNPMICVSSFFVGVVVGLTGMGGGALMTPVLVLLFDVEPLAAVSSDLVASMIMKPFGGFVHWRHGTVHRSLVLWLMVGSIPCAFAGVLILRSLGSGPALQVIVRTSLGWALILVASCLFLRPLMQRGREADGPVAPLRVRRLLTAMVGMVGGLVVGMTSVGSGSLMIMLLLLLYPRMRLSELVGTDLVQAIPLVSSAALAHLIFGELQLGLTASVIVGAIPGVFVGAQLSARASDHVIRPALMLVLVVSALKLLGASTLTVGIVAATLVPLCVGLAVVAARAARARRRQALAAQPSGPIMTPAGGASA